MDIVKFDFIDFVIFSIDDVRQVLPQYKDKNIPAAYAIWEEKWKEQQQLEWEEKLKQPKKGLANFVTAFSGGQMVCDELLTFNFDALQEIFNKKKLFFLVLFLISKNKYLLISKY